MILLAVNYRNELNLNFWAKFDFVEPVFFNELKGSIFAQKLIKHFYQNPKKYKAIIHFGTCGGDKSKEIGSIYRIDRTFLFHKDIIDNQRILKGKYEFKSIKTANIVTKFNIGRHSNKLYDFAKIFDLETFWLAQASSQLPVNVISIKGVCDHNDLFNRFNTNQEIEFLLDPDNKRKKINITQNKLKENIALVNKNFQKFFEEDFLKNCPPGA